MKKLFSGLCGLFLATGLMASATEQSPSSVSFTKQFVPDREISAQLLKTLSSEQLDADVVGVCEDSPLTAPANASTGPYSEADYLGSRTLMGHIYATRSLQSMTTNITKVSDTRIRFNGFFYADVNVEADVNWTTGEVTIPAGQKVAEVDSMGIYLCPINLKTNVFSSTDAIKGQLYNGAIHFSDSYGFFVTEGAQKGAYLNLGLVEYSAAATPNATITNKFISYGGDGTMTTANRTVTDYNTWAYTYPVSGDKMRVMHVLAVPSSNSYSDVLLTLSHTGAISIDPQPVYALSYYGDFCIYPLTEKIDADGKITNSISLINPVNSAYDASTKTLTWNPWAVASTSVGLLAANAGTTLVITEPIVFPNPPVSTFEGEGTENSPWLIKSAADMHALSQLVKEDATYRGNLITEGEDSYYNVYSGKYFRLASDIDYSELDATIAPIGSTTYRFNATFDGNGKSIKGYDIENYAYDYCALFACVGPQATICNFTMESPRLVSLGYTVAPVVARNYGVVEDINVVSPTVYATKGYNVGGAVSYNYGIIKNINVSGAYLYSLGYTGGVLARVISGKVENCHATGRVYATGSQVFAGGVVGYGTKLTLSSPGSEIRDCSFSGQVTANNNETGVGGLAGALAYSKVERCFANAVLIATSAQSCFVGGLVGTIGECQIYDSYVSGWVRNPYTANAGGLVGHSSEYTNPVGTTFHNCYSSAMLDTNSEDSMRGLAGNPLNISFDNCFYDCQMADVKNETYGMPTKNMTTGEGLKGFSASTWTFTAGMYPRLKSIGDSDAAAVSAASIHLDDADVLDNIAHDFTYSTTDNIVWKGVRNNNYTTEGGYAFNFDNGIGRLNYEQYTDTIFATRGNVSKYFIANIAPVLFNGEGSENNPWLINNLDDLKKLSQITNNATMPFTGKYFALTANIDCQGDTLQPICKDHSGTLAFAGTFDGRGFTIDNYHIMGVAFTDAGLADPKSSNSYYYSGLFGNIGAQGIVKNLTIGAKSIVEGFTYTGLLSGSNSGLIDNCSTYGLLKAYYGNAGALCGSLKEGGKISNSYNAATVHVNGTVAGGIAGWAVSATIENCENTGEVKAWWFNAYQKEGNQTIAGGIVGKADYSTIDNVVNSGFVGAYKQVGGIAGSVLATAAKPASISNAVNYGIVESWADKTTLGTIAGLNTLGSFNNCYADRQLQKAGIVANGSLDGVVALSTADLTAGNLPLSSEIWAQKQGLYPSMKRETIPAQVELNRNAVIGFGSADCATALFHTATLPTTVNWRLVKGEKFSIAGDKLNVTVPTEGVVLDTIIAYNGNIERRIPIATLNAYVFSGEGTEASPFQIASADDFLKLASVIKESGYDYEGMHFRLISDLDFTNKTFAPVGETIAFNGNFDGNGKTIDNVQYLNTEKTDLYKALFGYVGYAGTIRNLTLGGKSAISAYTYAAGIVAALYGRIDNCKNYAQVSTVGTTNAAGVAAIAFPGAVITKSANYGTVNAKTNYAAGILGSAAADARVKIAECSNEGEISATTSYAGGITAFASAIITDAYNKGVIKATTSYAGGIIANALLPSSLENCSNDGEIITAQYGAGVITTSAAHSKATPLIVKNCVNRASFTAPTKGYAGGVGGSMKAGTQFIDCSNEGSIAASSATTCIRIGGVSGDFTSTVAGPSSMRNVSNTGDISGYQVIGGISGYFNNAQNDGAYAIGCWNSGNVNGLSPTATATSGTSVGGIFGNGGSVIIEDCWNSGNISSNGGTVGGLIGQKNSYITSFARNFNVGTVTGGGSSVGGLIGYGRVGMVDCANFGAVKGADYVAGLLGYSGPVAATMYTLTFDRSFNAAKVEANTANVANTWNLNTGTKYYEVNSLWYDTDIMPATTADKKWENAIGLTTRQLCELEAGEAFDNIEAAYPFLRVHEGNDALAFAVASVLLSGEDSFDNVTKKFIVGLPVGAVWTGSSNLNINGAEVTPANKTVGEKAELTLKVGKYERTYNLTLKANTGIDNVDVEAPVAKRYYGYDGVEISTPADGQNVIEISVYSDGRTITRRIVYNK